MSFIKQNWVALVAIVIALGVPLFHLLPASPLGIGAASGPAHFQKESFLQGLASGARDQFSLDNVGNLTTTGTFKLGSSGTAQTNQVSSTCSIKSDASASATSTVYGYCTGVTGVTSADTVDAAFATSTTAWQDQWVITGAKASTTAGSIDFRILNLSGKAQAFSAATTIGSSTVIQAGH